MEGEFDYDLELDKMEDPKLPSEYLTKRVNSIINGIDLKQDMSLKKTLKTMQLEPEFIEKNIISKAKQYDHIPLAYNAQILVNQIRHDQQRQHLDFYQQLIGSYSSIEDKAKDLIQKADQLAIDHQDLNNCITSVDKDATVIMNDHQRFQDSILDMRFKQQALHALHKELTLTDQERSVLISTDEEELQSAKIKREKQLLSLDPVSEQDESDEVNQKFDRFKIEFFQALRKLNRMEEIAQVLRSEQVHSSLAQSITEGVKYVEEAAYSKLVKHLKNKIKVFDTPLENQPEFLIFMKVTLKMLREKSLDIYGHIINELIKARSSYIELSFLEKMNFIYYQDKSKNKNTEKVSNAKNVVQTITWLHETLVNEIQILDHTSLDKSRYLDALNSIFERNLAKKLKQRLDQEISSQEDFSHSFELYLTLVSFYQIMHENFVVKLKLSQKDDLSDLIILSFLTELKQKSLTQMADCAEPFLSKLHNLFFSQASESTLQIERFIKVTERIFKKVIDVMKTDKKDLEIFKKRVISYAIIRILPSMKIQNFAKDTNMLSANLVHLYNYYDNLFHLLNSFGKDLFVESISEIKKRLDYLSNQLQQAAVYVFQLKPCYKEVLASQTLTDFSQSLDDLLEDLDLEDASGFSKTQKQSPLLAMQALLIDQQLKQLLVELIKEQLLVKIRDALSYVVEQEQNQILENAEMGEEERDRKMRIVSHVEFEMTERIERIKKKIALK